MVQRVLLVQLVQRVNLVRLVHPVLLVHQVIQFQSFHNNLSRPVANVVKLVLLIQTILTTMLTSNQPTWAWTPTEWTIQMVLNLVKYSPLLNL